MKIGTKSILFGIHQVFVHTYYVSKAWKILYGKPTWKEFICIFVHDLGYIGKPNIDGIEGDKHPELGYKIAKKLLGKEYGLLCLYHSRHYARKYNASPSKLCWADKYSFVLENKKFYLFRSRLSGELAEVREISSKSGSIPATCSDEEWFDKVKEFSIDIVKKKDLTTFMKNEV